jgi:hypothetical protein
MREQQRLRRYCETLKIAPLHPKSPIALVFRKLSVDFEVSFLGSAGYFVQKLEDRVLRRAWVSSKGSLTGKGKGKRIPLTRA